MSHLQFHFTCVLILTLSWLNLRYKNMNTGRINQVIALVFIRLRRAAPPCVCLPQHDTVHYHSTSTGGLLLVMFSLRPAHRLTPRYQLPASDSIDIRGNLVIE